MNKKRIAGFVFIVLGIGILISNVIITGAVIGALIPNSLSLIAVIFLILGFVLTFQRDRNYAQEILKQGRYVDNTRELERIARKMGYRLAEGYKEGTKVYKGDKILTVIPSHRKIGGKGTSKSILEALATGESSFRKRQAHV